MQTVTIAAPLCAPSRNAITGTVRRQLAPYQYKLGNISAEQVRDGDQPQYWLVKVDFTDEAARWGEYVLLRYGYQRIGRYVDPRNERWAAPYLTERAPGPWYAPSCQDRPRHVAGEIHSANPPPPWAQQPTRERSATHRPKRSRPGGLLDLLAGLLDRI